MAHFFKKILLSGQGRLTLTASRNRKIMPRMKKKKTMSTIRTRAEVRTNLLLKIISFLVLLHKRAIHGHFFVIFNFSKNIIRSALPK